MGRDKVSMAFPAGAAVIDTMLGVPSGMGRAGWYDWLRPFLRDNAPKVFKFGE